jgi:hypothetical protein
MRAHEVPVALRGLPEYVRTVFEAAQCDEFFFAGDAGPAFFGAEFVFPLVLLVSGEVEEGLAGAEEGFVCELEGMGAWWI